MGKVTLKSPSGHFNDLGVSGSVGASADHKSFCPFTHSRGNHGRLLHHSREEHSMDQYRSRLKVSENFEGHWSISFPGEIHMDQSLVHTFSCGNSYGPMVLKVLQKFPPTLVLVHGWLFPAFTPLTRIHSLHSRSASKCHFQSVLLRQANLCVPGSPLGTSLRSRTTMTLVHAQQHKAKQASFF